MSPRSLVSGGRKWPHTGQPVAWPSPGACQKGRTCRHLPHQDPHLNKMPGCSWAAGTSGGSSHDTDDRLPAPRLGSSQGRALGPGSHPESSQDPSGPSTREPGHLRRAGLTGHSGGRFHQKRPQTRPAPRAVLTVMSIWGSPGRGDRIPPSQLLLNQNQRISRPRTPPRRRPRIPSLASRASGHTAWRAGAEVQAVRERMPWTCPEEAEQRQLLPAWGGETEAQRAEQPAQGPTAERGSSGGTAHSPLPSPPLHSHLPSRSLGQAGLLSPPAATAASQAPAGLGIAGQPLPLRSPA